MPLAKAMSPTCSSVRPETSSSAGAGQAARPGQAGLAVAGACRGGGTDPGPGVPGGLGEQAGLRGAHPDGVAGTAGDELGHAAVRDQPPPPDHDEVVGGVLHLRHQVAGHQHGPALGRERLHQGADPPDAFRVQPAPGPLPADVGQAGQAEDLIHPGGGDPVGLGQAAQVVAGAAAAVHGPGVQQRPDLAHRGGRPLVRLAVDGDDPRTGPVQAEDQPHGRGLPGAVPAEEPGHGAAPDPEAQVSDRRGRSVPLGESARHDHHAPPPGRPGARQRPRYGRAAARGSRPAPNLGWVLTPARAPRTAAGGG